ncbi:MAG TPA: hypothetical protein VMK84_34300 [Streptosporangiaceae bacterium]|nr:hypothetical protein [Streptosporangiaceae bacterium]
MTTPAGRPPGRKTYTRLAAAVEAFAEILAEAPVPLDAHAAGVRITNQVSRETDAMLTAPPRAAGP